MTGSDATVPTTRAWSSIARAGTARPSATTPESAGMTPGADASGDASAVAPPNAPFATATATAMPMTTTVISPMGSIERRRGEGSAVMGCLVTVRRDHAQVGAHS